MQLVGVREMAPVSVIMYTSYKEAIVDVFSKAAATYCRLARIVYLFLFFSLQRLKFASYLFSKQLTNKRAR